MKKAVILSAIAISLYAQTNTTTTIERMPRGEYKAPEDAKVGVGQIRESKTSGGYLYLKVHNEGRDFWVVTSPEYASLPVDTWIRFKEEVASPKFESKSLNQTLEDVIFTTELEFMRDLKADEHSEYITEVVEVSPYAKAGSKSLKEIFTNREKLKDKKVTTRAKVVKVSKNIQGRNWIHLQDGTAVEDLPLRIVTTSDKVVNVGDIVEATGVVRVDKEFGTGYVYKIIIENTEYKK